MTKGFASTTDMAEKKITFSEIGTDLYAFTAEGDPNSAVIVGDELADGHVQLKDLEAGTQHLVPLEALAKDLARAAKSHHHG